MSNTIQWSVNYIGQADYKLILLTLIGFRIIFSDYPFLSTVYMWTTIKSPEGVHWYLKF